MDWELVGGLLLLVLIFIGLHFINRGLDKAISFLIEVVARFFRAPRGLGFFIPLMASVLCVGALLPDLPHDYFTLARWWVCASCGWSAYKAAKSNAEAISFTCMAAALLFNPFIKVSLGRETWWWIDGIAAIYLIIVANRLRS